MRLGFGCRVRGELEPAAVLTDSTDRRETSQRRAARPAELVQHTKGTTLSENRGVETPLVADTEEREGGSGEELSPRACVEPIRTPSTPPTTPLQGSSSAVPVD